MLPLTRDENWLAMIAGDPDADESMIPRTRKEYFLKEIADNQGGGGGGGAGLPPVTSADNGKVLGVENGEWSKTSRGYTIETTESIIVPQQSVTTETVGDDTKGAITTVDGLPTIGDNCKVTFEGTTYTVEATESLVGGGIICLGEETSDADLGVLPDFTNYPFRILLADMGGYMGLLDTPTAGTYTVKVETTVKSADVDDDFVVAVKAASPVLVANIIVTGEDPDLTFTLDKTWREIADADFCVIHSTEEISEDTSYSVFDCVERVGVESGTYIVAGLSGSAFATDSPNGYPVRVSDT